MNWSLVPQQLVTGLLNGGTIGLIALGIVLIYKSSEVFNFAHGHLLMFGAFLTWWFTGGAQPEGAPVDLPLWAAVIAALIVSMGVGLLVERFALRPMTGQPLLAIMLMTLGLAQLFEGVTAVLFGVELKSNFPSPFSPSDVLVVPFPGAFGDAIRLKYTLVATFAVAVVAAGLFIWFFYGTRLGLAMRATAESHEVARSVGIKVSRVFGLSWGIAGVIATLGGVLLATASGVSLNLSTVALIAFPAILLGGLESLGGAVLGGFAIGLAQALVQASRFVEVRNSAEIAPFLLLLAVLLARPEGLFGQKRIERI